MHELSRLGSHIRDSREVLVRGWLEFAKTLLPVAAGLSDEELLDSIPNLLDALAANIDAAQAAEPVARLGGEAEDTPGSKIDDYSRAHAGTRLSQGFSIEQVVCEYAALRINVLRHCFDDAVGTSQLVSDVVDLDRSIDRCLFESVAWFSHGLSSARDLFLGALGHDLRSPLGAITTLASVLLQDPHAEPRTMMAAARVASSAARMSKMIQHLLDFARTRLGGLLPLTTTRIALAPLLIEAVEETRAALPDAVIRCSIEGPLEGHWDADRIPQLVTNLIANAYQHGVRDRPIDVLARVEEGDVVLSVHNEGPAIPESIRRRLFEPLAQASTTSDEHPVLAGSVGLGLYICREIARAHGGEIEAISGGSGTTFRVRMPSSPRDRRH